MYSYIVWGNILALVFVVIFFVLQLLTPKKTVTTEPTKLHIGDITTESLQYYCGYDFMKPILVAVRGLVIDVSTRTDLYGPGRELHVYAGKEISRALALGSVRAEDCGSDQLHDLGEKEIQRLEAAFSDLTQLQKLDVVGQVVPLRNLTLEELAKHNGSNCDQFPLYLAIQGVVFNVMKGKDFYGPDGVYPFAGHECARALALMSTEIKDCNANIEGLSSSEMETLRDWKARFSNKYPIVGKIAS
ncbi:hypothetical protein CEUSTIGMA_g6171.t1 [Chlamydomonas eustigma]|uniref:Cytochrome b5 heme-binding domain-containing protein n=1 Tax=Chlamydomonas eustigma TaxID=1157962 RepID=A0A250X6L9_9CHLO|nr:hypothetical protein CEUSTIGMA_g6171.t1 [Chlamydomonas eustigma]|eukprot:GAX78734.1 hypothetical protein CEUSTIGMA_g6171.t1 [Chlamydomonas eustigma]